MKNIVICFDGTWGSQVSPYPSNVLKTANLILPTSALGQSQIVFYDDGLGYHNSEAAKVSNDPTNNDIVCGPMKSVHDAYRFLCLNYVLGDRIYLFGYSRGAFNARSLVGLVENCGILKKESLSHIANAIQLYLDPSVDTQYDGENALEFRKNHALPCFVTPQEDACNNPSDTDAATPAQCLKIQYIGLWDTVGKLGIPDKTNFANQATKQCRLQSSRLTNMVKSARHAVALDETRRELSATLWDNIAELNHAAGANLGPIGERPYLQQWFPGDHGSVGGGAEETGLSNATLLWVLDGAYRRGLDVNRNEFIKIQENIDHTVSTYCMEEKRVSILSSATRKPRTGPSAPDLSDLSEIAQLRYLEDVSKLPGARQYRPRSLQGVEQQLKIFSDRSQNFATAR